MIQIKISNNILFLFFLCADSSIIDYKYVRGEGNLKKTLYILFFAALFLSMPHQPADASSSAKEAVSDAEKMAETLSDKSSVPGRATGKNLPEKEYTAAKAASSKAEKLVKKMASGKTKTNYQSRLKKVSVKISRGRLYISAVKAGKKISADKAAFDKAIKKNVYSNAAHKAYNNMKSQLKKQTPAVNKAYGTKTNALLKKLYITPAQKKQSEYAKAAAVRQAINDADKLISSNASNKKILIPYKKALLGLETVPQKNVRKQLRTDFNRLHRTIIKRTAGKKDALALLASLESDFQRLDSLVSPGKSAPDVPKLKKQIEKAVKSYSKTERTALTKRLNTIMAGLSLPVDKLKEALTAAAFAKGFPPEVVKAVARTENGKWQQFTPDGEVFKSADNGYGIMQVTPLSDTDTRYDWNRVKYDTVYNIQTGVEILETKWHYASSKVPVLPSVNKQQKNILENWYFAIMAYNGLSARNHPSSKFPYQIKVYSQLKTGALTDPYVLTEKELKITIKEGLLSFDRMSYTTGRQTPSTQLYQTGTKIKLKQDIRIRTEASTGSKSSKVLKKGTTVTITGRGYEDSNTANLYNWYKIKASGLNGTWYTASMNL